MDKRRHSKNHDRKRKSSSVKSGEVRDDLKTKKESPLDHVQSETMQSDENRRHLEAEPSQQSLNNETTLTSRKPSLTENESSLTLKNTEKAKKPHLIENEMKMEHSHKKKKGIVSPFKRRSLLENEQSDHLKNRKHSSASSKKPAVESESSDHSIHKRKKGSPKKKKRSISLESESSSVEALHKDKSKQKHRKDRHSSDDGKKHKHKKTEEGKSEQEKERHSSSQDSDHTDSSREPTPPVVIVDWSRRCKSMEQKVKKAIKSQKVVVFAKKETDPNIEQVKNLMAQYCITYGLVELDDSPYFETQLYNMTCCRCLPLIFIDGMFLGGLYELKTLEGMGRMKELSSCKKVKPH